MSLVIKLVVLVAALYAVLVLVGFGVGTIELLALLAVFLIGVGLIIVSERRKPDRR